MKKEDEAKETIRRGSIEEGAAEGTPEKIQEETQKTVKVEKTECMADEKEVKEAEKVGMEVLTVNLEASRDLEDRAGAKEETTNSENAEDVNKELKNEKQQVERVDTAEMKETKREQEKVADVEETKREQETVADMEETKREQEKVADVEETKRDQEKIAEGEETKIEQEKVADQVETKREVAEGKEIKREQEKVADAEETKREQEKVAVWEKTKSELEKVADGKETKQEQGKVEDGVEKRRMNTANVQEKQDVTQVETYRVKTTGVNQTSDAKRVDMDQKETGTLVEESTHVEEGKAGVGQPSHIGSPHLPAEPSPLNDKTESLNSTPEFFSFEDFEVVDTLEDEDEEEEEEDEDKTKSSSSQQRHSRQSRSHTESSRSRHRRSSRSRERSKRGRNDPKDSREKGRSSSRSSKTSSRYKDDRGHHAHSRDKRKEEERVNDKGRYRHKSPRRTHGKDDVRRRRSRSPRKDASSSASRKDGLSSSYRKDSATSASKKDTSSSSFSSALKMDMSGSSQKNDGSSYSNKKESSSSTQKRSCPFTSRKDPSSSSKKEPSSFSLKEDTPSSILKGEASSLGPIKEVLSFTSPVREQESARQFPNKPLNEDPSKNISTRETQEHQGVDGVSLTPSDAVEQRNTESENQDRSMEKIEITKGKDVKKDEARSKMKNAEVQPNDKTVEIKDKISENDKDSQGNTEPLMALDSSGIEVQRKELRSSSMKCELSNLVLKTNIGTQPHNIMEMDGNDSLSGNKGQEPIVGESGVSSKVLTPQNNKSETVKRKDESKPQTIEDKPIPAKKNEMKELEVDRSELTEIKERKIGGKEEGSNIESELQTAENNEPMPNKGNEAEPQETKERKMDETLNEESPGNQEKSMTTRTRSGRRPKTPVVALRRSTRFRKKVDEPKEEITKGTIDEVDCEVRKEENMEVEEVVCEENLDVQERTTHVEQITKEQGKKESDNASLFNSNRNIMTTEDMNPDIEDKSSKMQQKNEDKGIKKEEKLDLTSQEDTQGIISQITHQNTHTIQNQAQAEIDKGKAMKKREDTPEHTNQRSRQENLLQISQTEVNELRATQWEIVELTQERVKGGSISNIDGNGKDDTSSLKAEVKMNKKPQDPEAESTEKKEKEQEHISNRKEDDNRKNDIRSMKTEDKRNMMPLSTEEKKKESEKKGNITSKEEDGDMNKDTSLKTQEDKRSKSPYESEAGSAEKKINIEVLSHEGNRRKEKDTLKERDTKVIVSSLEGQKIKESCKHEQSEENNDISSGKSEEGRTAMEQEAKPLDKPSKEPSSKKLGRYSKVVVVGDARMSLLATPDIKEHLRGGTQVLMVPQLSLEGLLDVVKKEVVKETEKQDEHSRGTLLLCLAGLHETLVKLQVPDECRLYGHMDMQEMVCAMSDDSLDPKFTKSLAKIKSKVQWALGKGSQVLFFPVLPVDMANYNAIRAKQHFEATGHKLQQQTKVEILHHHLLEEYKQAVSKINSKSYASLSLVPFNFNSRLSCRRFTDELLQDGYMPTLDLIERHILPQIQRTIRTATTLRFPQVVFVGDRRLGQVVARQREKGVEPCTFILQEQLGLRYLTTDSPTVKQLSGLSRALIVLTISLGDLIPLASISSPDSKEKAKCSFPHNMFEAMNQFVEEMKRVDQLLRSATHHCIIITTPIMPFDDFMLTKSRGGKRSLCCQCRQTIMEVKRNILYFNRILSQENCLPPWNLNTTLEKFHNKQYGERFGTKSRQKDSGSQQWNKLEHWLVKEAANSWEYYLVSLQKPYRAPKSTTITSILQNPKHISVLVPQDKEIHTAHSKDNKDREYTHSKDNKDKEYTHSKDNKDREYTHSKDNKDREYTHSTHSSHNRSKDRRRRGRSSSPPRSLAVDEITSPPSSPAPDRHANRDLDSISSGDMNFPQSPCPSIINSPENFMDTSPSHTSNSRDMHKPHQPQEQPSTECSSSGKRLLPVDSKDRSPSPQKVTSALDGLHATSYQEGRRERLPSIRRYPSPAPNLSRGRSRSRSRSIVRGISRRSRSRSRSRSRKEIIRGRVPRNASPAWLPHTPSRPLYRRSLSRSLSPLQPLRSTSRGRRSTSRSKSPISRVKSISKGRRSISRGRRSASRGRRSISRGRRSFSRGRRSFSRGRRSISRGIRSLSWGKRSNSRGRRSVSRGISPISRTRRSFSRGGRSLSRGRSVSRRSVSRGRPVSRGRRSISRGRRSLSRGRRGRSSSREKHSTARFPSQQDTARESMITDALRTLRSVHERECEMYRNNPTIHPDIGVEYVRFCDKKTQNILALGGDPTQYNIAEEWRVFWQKRMEEVFSESWRVKLNQCLDALETHKKPSSPPRPALKTRRSYSPSASSLYSSDNSSSGTSSRRKRKRRKRMRRSSSFESSKRKRKMYDNKLSPPKSYPRIWTTERSPSVSERSQRYEERSPEYPRVKKKRERSEDQDLDRPATKISDTTRARQKEGSMKYKERQMSSSPESFKRDGQGWRSQENLKEQVQEHQSSPLLMSQAIREAWDQDIVERQNEQKNHYPSPPRVYENKQQEQSKRYYPSPPGMSENNQIEQSKTYYPSPQEVSSEECGKARNKWHQSPSPIDHQATHSDSQHTTKHSIRDFIPVDDLLLDVRNVVEEIQEVGEQVEEDKVKPPSIVRELWLQLSNKKSISKSSDGPEVTAESEGWSHEPYLEHAGRPSARGRDCQGQQDDPLQEARAREDQAQQDDPTHPGQARDLDSLISHSHSHTVNKELQKTYSSHRSKKQSVTEIFRSFASEKIHSSTSTTTSKPGHHEDEASSTTALEEATKIDIDVVNVLEVLTHLGDKLGALCAPLKLVHQRADELRMNGTDPIVIMSDSDNKFLLQMIQEKLQGILKDGQLSIIKKVIVQEAEQRLSVLLERQKQHSLLGGLSLSHLARRCLDMDAPTTVAYIREVLLCRGQAHPPQDHLMKLYMAVKEEQLKIVRDQHNDEAAAAAAAAFAEDTKPTQQSHLLSSRGSVGLPHAAAFAKDPKPQSHTQFVGGSSNKVPPRAAAITKDPESPQHIRLAGGRTSIGPHHSTAFAKDHQPTSHTHILGTGGNMGSPHAVAFTEDRKPSPHSHFSASGANTALHHGAAFADYPKPPTLTQFSGGGANMVPPQAPALALSQPTPLPPLHTKPRTRPSRFEPLPLRVPPSQLEASLSSSGIRPAPPPPTLACPVSHSSTSQTWSLPSSNILEAPTPSASHSTDSTIHSVPHSITHFPSTVSQATHVELNYQQPSSKWYVSKKPIRITLPKQQPQKGFLATFNPLGDDTDSEEC